MIANEEWAQAICKLLKLDPNQVTRLDFSIGVGGHTEVMALLINDAGLLTKVVKCFDVEMVVKEPVDLKRLLAEEDGLDV